MRRFFVYAAIITGAFGVLALVGLLALYQAARHEPEFYTKALDVDRGRYAEAGDELEQQVFELRNDAQREGRWEANFTDEQINGWLAVDLPEKFPAALPKEVHDPRVAIEPETVYVAARYEGKISTVVNLTVEVTLTDEPNVVAVRIRQARAGLIPVPLEEWREHVSAAAARAEIPLRWTQQDGDLVALVTIPGRYEDFDRRELRIESIELSDGEIHLAGRTVREDTQTAAVTPRGYVGR